MRHGGVVRDRSGRATALLARLVNYEGTNSGISQLLTALSRTQCQCGEHFLISRERNEKRVFEIAAAPCLLQEQRTESVDESDDVDAVEVEPAPEIDYDLLALEIVEVFVDTLAPKVVDPELQRRLASVHEHARNLESKLTRVRSELAQAGDELRAKDTTIAGLRERLRAAEANIERLKAGATGNWSDADEAIDRLMRERPSSKGF